MDLLGGTDFQHSFDRYKMLLRLQLAGALGCFFILSYSVQFYRSGCVVRIASVGVLVAGASLFLGFLLGFIFCIPRTAKPGEAMAALSSGQGDSKDTGTDSTRRSTAIAITGVETNTNLVDISDWLTKILVGVGLVELNKIPQSLRQLAIFLGPGLRSSDAATYVASSEAFAMGIVLFFFGAGFLIGYLWTRLYFQTALSDLANLASQVDNAWAGATDAEILMRQGRLDEAMKAVDNALKESATNAKALFTKARILRRLAQAGGPPGDKSLLQEALAYASKAAALLPNKGGPVYNMACYQALLGVSSAEVLKTLKRAVQLNPQLKQEALVDEDFVSLRELPEFKELIESADPSVDTDHPTR